MENKREEPRTKYTSRSLRRRGDSDKWEVTLTHDDPYTDDSVRTYHTIEAKTERQARKKRDELILDMERKGGYYEKESKTESGVRTLPLTTRTWSHLNALKKDVLRTLVEWLSG